MSHELSLGKVIFILVKVTLIVIMMVLGMRSHYSMTNRVDSIFKLFLYYIFLMILLCLYEFAFPLIPLLYINLVMSGMGKLWGVWILVEKAKKFQSHETNRRLKHTLGGFFGIDLFLLMITPFRAFGAYCHPGFIYPLCFMMFLYVEVLLFYFTSKLYLNDFYMNKA
jgi:hypothetical protein